MFQLWWWTMNLPTEWREFLMSTTPCEWWGWAHCPR